MISSPTKTLVQILLERTQATPEALVYRFLPDGEKPAQELTYRALWSRASAIARCLAAEGKPGARVLILCPPGLDYIVGLWGCLLACQVAVPALPPRFNRPSSRFQALLSDSSAEVALITQSLVAGISRARDTDPKLAGLRFLCVDEILKGRDATDSTGAMAAPSDKPEALAVLQYTSGSTSSPRGVMLSHAHLITNCRAGAAAAAITEDSEIVSWLPPYHDMGLIGTLLVTPVVGCRATLMSPFSFVTQPARWLAAITRYRGTHGGGPDSAYALCAQRVTEAQKRTLDLSSWQVAWNGSERVRVETLNAFVQAFKSVGFRRSALRPCYGLAEATLTVTFAGAQGAQLLPVSESSLAQHRAEPTHGAENARWLASSGRVIGDHQLRVVDPDRHCPLPDGQVGELWVQGPSIAYGYFGRPELSEITFRARLNPDDGSPWLRTGDLGFVRDGEVYVTGRIKDLLIVRGTNYYPEDIEFVAQSTDPALVLGAGAAFSIEVEGAERICLVQEVQGRGLDFAGLAHRLEEAVFVEHELVLFDTWLVVPGQVPRTSSGKVQRCATKARYLAGEFNGRFRALEQRAAAEATPSPLEPLVAQACCELLGLSTLGRNDDLLALGAQSVVITQLAARLELQVERRIPLRSLFDAPTVARIARALEEADRLPRPPPISGAAGADWAPLSLAQQRMWVEYELQPSASAYNISGALQLRGDLSTEVLEQLLNEEVQRHAILRTRYDVMGQRPVQRVDPFSPQPLEVVQVGSEAEAVHRAETLARAPFDLRRDRPFRVCLFRVAPGHHLLAFVLHHIAGDGLSLDLIIEDLFSAYESAGAIPPLLGISYMDYARWQEATFLLSSVSQSIDYWKAQLAGAPGLLGLPTDHPRPPCLSYRGGRILHELSPALIGALDALGRVHRCTRYMTLLTVYYVLLARLSSESDISVGTPVSGREQTQTQGLVGNFVNLLTLRAQVSQEISFIDLLARVRETALAAFEHQDAPFESVVNALSPARTLAHTPLFQVLFDCQVMRRLRSRCGDLDVAPVFLARGASQYDLSLSVLDTGSATHLHLEYRTDLFDPETAEGLVRRFVALMESVVLDPRLPVGQLQWLEPQERQAILALGTGHDRSQDAYRVFPDAVESWAARTPDQCAVRDAKEQLSYGDLELRANRLAHYLKSHGVGPDIPVGVFLERTVTLPVVLLAILKAGGCYVPLDPLYPAARIRAILEDAAPHLVISESGLVASLPTGPADRVLIDSLDTILPEQPDTPPDRAALEPEYLAYILFTSGSTGRPKGVAVSHGALANFLQSMAREPGLQARDCLLAVTTVSFDIAALELFLPLTVGARVELASRRLASDGVALASRLMSGEITCFQATPATYRMLLEAGFAGHPVLRLLCGGEALPRDLAEALLQRCAVLYNLYGPTETTVWSACGRIQSGEGPIPLGAPIDRTRLYVLDPAGEPTPKGVPGELYIGGDGVARGYYGRPDLTVERFLPDPFRGKSAVMYRTGDRVRWRSEGSLEFLGRLDQQVKLRGFRVELSDVEAHLAQFPAVEACAVVLCEVAPSDVRLVAHVVVRRGHRLNRDSIRAGLAQHLPEYMVPSMYMELPALPLTPNGKVDRKSLPRPEFCPSEQRSVIAPRDESEAQLCQLFWEILGHPVGITDSFFEQGGHSILAVRLFERLYALTGRRLPLATLFRAPTVEQLVRLLREEPKLGLEPTRAECVTLSNPPVSDSLGTPELVFVHPSGTGGPAALEWYRPLVKAHHGGAVAVYCEENVFLELQEVAALQVEALQRRAPRRPRILIGLGLGGNLAQEMAVQLEAAGEPVPRVVAIQSLVPEVASSWSWSYVTRAIPNLLGATRRFARLRPEQRITRLVVWRERLRTLVSQGRFHSIPEFETVVDRASLPAGYRELSGPQWNALARHQPRPCSAEILVLRGHRHGLLPLSDHSGWSGLSRTSLRTQVLDLPGNRVPDPSSASLVAEVLVSLGILRSSWANAACAAEYSDSAEASPAA